MAEEMDEELDEDLYEENERPLYDGLTRDLKENGLVEIRLVAQHVSSETIGDHAILMDGNSGSIISHDVFNQLMDWFKVFPGRFYYNTSREIVELMEKARKCDEMMEKQAEEERRARERNRYRQYNSYRYREEEEKEEEDPKKDFGFLLKTSEGYYRIRRMGSTANVPVPLQLSGTKNSSLTLDDISDQQERVLQAIKLCFSFVNREAPSHAELIDVWEVEGVVKKLFKFRTRFGKEKRVDESTWFKWDEDDLAYVYNAFGPH